MAGSAPRPRGEGGPGKINHFSAFCSLPFGFELVTVEGLGKKELVPAGISFVNRT
jgi:hypothetical protein